MGSNWHIIITSRNDQLRYHSPSHYRELEALALEDAIALLLNAALIDEAEWPAYEASAKEVAETLSLHTLALVQAGKYIASGRCTLSEYTSKYESTNVDTRLRMLDYGSQQEMSRHRSVLATFNVSANALETSHLPEDRDAMHLLQTLSVMHHTHLPTVIFEDAWHGAFHLMKRRSFRASRMSFYNLLRSWNAEAAKTFMRNVVPPGPSKQHAHHLVARFLPQIVDDLNPERLHKAELRLSSLALIKRNTTTSNTKMISMHPLVHTWARLRQTPLSQQEAWMSAGSIIVLSNKAMWSNLSDWIAREHPSSSTWMKWAMQLMPHVRSFAKNRTMVDTVLAGSIMEKQKRKSMIMEAYVFCARLMQMMREDKAAKALIEHAFEKLNGDYSYLTTEVIVLAKTKAANLLNCGDTDGGRLEYDYVGQWEKWLLPEGHPNWLNSQRGLARSWNDEGNPEEAAKILEDVVKIQKVRLKGWDLSLLTSQHELARTYRLNGEADKAVDLLKYVIKMKDATLKEEAHIERLTSRRELALAYQATDQISESIELLEYLMEVESRALSPENPERLASQHALALVYRRAGRMDDALQVLERVVALEKDNFDETNPQRLLAQYDLARTYREKGECCKALELLEETADHSTKKFITKRLGYLSASFEIILASVGAGKIDDAISFMSDLIEDEEEGALTGKDANMFVGMEWVSLRLHRLSS